MEFYILGLLRFYKENVGESVVLSENQLDYVKKEIESKIQSMRIKTEYRDPWHVWSLKCDEIFKQLRKSLENLKVQFKI